MKKPFGLSVLVLALSLFTGGTLTAKEAPPAFPKGEEVKVKAMSYNIHHGAGDDNVLDLKRVGDVLAASGADIIGLQEVDNHWSSRSDFEDEARWLADYLGMQYAFGANLDRDPLEEDGNRRQYGNAVLSRYPIIAQENHLLTSDPLEPRAEQRGMLEAVVNVKGNHVHFYSTHLGLSVAERTVQTGEVARIVSERGGTAIVTGDFNAAPDTVEMENMAVFEDAFASSGDAYTFPVENPRIRADYIFFTGDMDWVSAEVIRTNASDHLPVTAEFLLKRTTPGASADSR
ncbi:metal-dependent hydrolase [Paenibacillus sp. J31TS4]|uniref:endonuclease/exonuclease/phosphatase family protein n=1 Tax=Paenibacillus sp. J31TS4 TaxID=2807195 RepID=UPI001B2BD092|nr:endonuclease/exonuclease/phosphatase family protein [Paenibacillus sp. J31TS4]GIP40530.1 metal-dependent hydrolase [Paenibacillus sp. J31TS4]